MLRMALSIFLGLAVVTLPAIPSAAIEKETSDDKQEVERACLDYVEALYHVKPELIERSVHPRLRKFGFWLDGEKGEYVDTEMTFEQLRELARKWNKDGHVDENAEKKIEVFDVQDKTAAAKLTAVWGTDYFHLIKEDGKWMIYQILWQSPQPTDKSP